jgi:alpha-amylase
MACVCCYFQVHQPPRLRRYSIFDRGAAYFDQPRNTEILEKVAAKCYRPVTRILGQLLEDHGGDFRVAFSMTGSVLEQLQRDAPDVLDRFAALARSGHVEFLAETYHHSLAALYSEAEFAAQVQRQQNAIEQLFGQRPTVFRNTELIYSNTLADQVAALDNFKGMLAEGVDGVLAGRSPNRVYHPAGQPEMGLLLKHYRLSDDIAFRFSDQGWSGWPLTADKFADAIEALDDSTQVVNLFMDLETFGEHQWEETGIFEFLQALPGELLKRGHTFATPGECLDAFAPSDQYDAPEATSWADTERDLSAWLSNAMQSSALQQLYDLELPIKESGDAQLLGDWRMLTTSDHFYYMCTKFYADQAVHRYFNPYESPYDAYINFMNVLDDLRTRVSEQTPAAAPAPPEPS